MTIGIPGLLKYAKGDATTPQAGGHKLIIHINNNLTLWNSGFVVSLSKRWAKPEDEYKKWGRSQVNFKLGEIQAVDVQSDITVVNMIAQNGIKSKDNPVPLDLPALEKCLIKVAKLALETGASIHAPRLGSVRAGGKWLDVEALLIKTLIKKGVNVTVYDFEQIKTK